MPYVFQSINRKTGKPHRKWRFQYTDYAGERRSGTGLTSKIETEKLATKIESEHDEIRKGYRPLPSKADKHKRESFRKFADEYIAWGKSQGGRGGRAWGDVHERKRIKYLSWWEKELDLQMLADLEGSLPRIEMKLRELQQVQRSGKTIEHYAEGLHSFCQWCVVRNYLSDNPIKRLKKFDTTPKTIRRAITLEEILKLLSVAPSHRRLLYETAFCTGLRANELRSLTINDLDVGNCELKLRAEWTKNRKNEIQPLPMELAQRLDENAKKSIPAQLYREFYSKKNISIEPPENALLYVSSHPSRELDKDLKEAGIPKNTEEGKIDFHGCRVAYVTFVLNAGATVKEAQSLARHSNPSLTMNVYARTNKGRLA
ncbi:MAG: hypothetical protein A2X45_01135, partial [Lentisphaerae bacterium GWF2_50_93]